MENGPGWSRKGCDDLGYVWLGSKTLSEVLVQFADYRKGSCYWQILDFSLLWLVQTDVLL